MHALSVAAIAAACLAVVSPELRAQRVRKGHAVLWDRLDGKLAEEWVTNAEWITDFVRAKELAAKTGKHIFVYLTRSYAP